MGRRGPPAKPAALKKAQGTYKKSRDEQRRTALELPAGCPPIPETLSEAARAIWIELAPQLVANGTLAKVDGGIMESYCRALAQTRRLDEESNADPVVTTPFGPKVNPAIPLLAKLWPVVEKLAFDLGLHYVARSRVAPPKPEEVKDPDEAFMFGEAATGKPAKPVVPNMAPASD